MGNGQVLGTDPVPTFLLRVLEALKSKNRRGSSIKEIAEFVSSSYRHCDGDILSQVQISLNKAVRQGMVKQDKKSRYYLVPPVIQFMESCLPQSAVCNAVMGEVLPTDKNSNKNCLENMVTALDTGPLKCKKCDNNNCNCRIGCGCPSSSKRCRIKTKLRLTARREKAAHISKKYCKKMKIGLYTKIVKCPECFRILSMKRI